MWLCCRSRAPEPGFSVALQAVMVMGRVEGKDLGIQRLRGCILLYETLCWVTLDKTLPSLDLRGLIYKVSGWTPFSPEPLPSQHSLTFWFWLRPSPKVRQKFCCILSIMRSNAVLSLGSFLTGLPLYWGRTSRTGLWMGEKKKEKSPAYLKRRESNVVPCGGKQALRLLFPTFEAWEGTFPRRMWVKMINEAIWWSRMKLVSQHPLCFILPNSCNQKSRHHLFQSASPWYAEAHR